MKYKISEKSDFEIVNENGDFIANVIDDRKSISYLIDNAAELKERAQMIVDALNKN
jgi:hypothetical protein